MYRSLWDSSFLQLQQRDFIQFFATAQIFREQHHEDRGKYVDQPPLDVAGEALMIHTSEQEMKAKLCHAKIETLFALFYNHGQENRAVMGKSSSRMKYKGEKAFKTRFRRSLKHTVLHSTYPAEDADRIANVSGHPTTCQTLTYSSEKMRSNVTLVPYKTLLTCKRNAKTKYWKHWRHTIWKAINCGWNLSAVAAFDDDCVFPRLRD